MNERRRRPGRHPGWLAVLALAVAGCAAGPDFVRPAAPGATRYTAGDPVALSDADGHVEQAFRPGAVVPEHWWQAFGSPALDQLVDTGLAHNATLEGARATLAQAKHLLDAARGAAYPQLNLLASARRTGDGRGVGAATAGDAFALGPSLSFNPDAFGATRRRVEQAQALADDQLAQWRGAQLSLTGNIVLQAVALGTARAQLAALRDIVAVDRRSLELVRVSATAGKSARLDVLTAQSQLAGDLALFAPLEQQASAARHAIAVLAGQSSAEWAPPEFELAGLTLPRELPLVIPSALVRRRPDILSAEAQLHAASAAIGIAAAQLYPNIVLSADWTASSGTLGGLFGGDKAWSVAASLVAPLFNGGTLAAQRAAATDAYAAQLASYRAAVLAAFAQVADVLESLRHDADLANAVREALATAQATLELTQESYQAGQASLLQLLEAQRLYQQARLGFARAEGQRYADTAQLFIAMGGAPPGAPE